jgi:Zn-dependent protease
MEDEIMENNANNQLNKSVQPTEPLIEQPINTIQTKIFSIVKKYYDIQVFKIIKEVFIPVTCIIYLERETATDKFQEMNKDLESIGISSRLTRVSKSELVKIPELRRLDKTKTPCHIKFDTIYLKKTDSQERRKNLIASVVSIIITAGTIALSAWFYFTKMDPVFAYANNSHPQNVLNSIYFGVGMFLIIFLHEMGHKIASDKNKIKASFPVLIPGPPPLGMLGAYVSIKDMMKTRNNMYDIALAGLISGFICAFVLLVIGFFLTVQVPTSEFLTLMANMTGKSEYECAETLASQMNNYDFLVLAIQKIFFPGPISQSYYYSNLLPDYIIALHPIAFAGWIGIVLTGLNLVPVSFLDGGLVFHAVFPQKWGKILGVAIGIIVFSTIDSFMRLFAIFSLSSAMSDLMRTDVDPADIAYPLKPLSKGRYIISIFLIVVMIVLYPLSGDSLIYGFSS